MKLSEYVFPSFLPDQSINSVSLRTAQNAYRAIDGFRPVKAFNSVSDVLNDDFKGGGSFIYDDGTAFLLAGTTDGLESLGSGTWTDKITGLSVTGRWKFSQFGNFVVCVNGLATQEYIRKRDKPE